MLYSMAYYIRSFTVLLIVLYGQIRVGIPVSHAYGMEDLLYKYGVDIHLEAHEHSYERLWPVYNLQVCRVFSQAEIHLFIVLSLVCCLVFIAVGQVHSFVAGSVV